MTKPVTIQTVKIDSITYEVVKCGTPESYEAQNLPALAAHMREYKQAKQLYLKRPNGKRHYFVIQATNGVYSTVSSLRG